MLGIVGTGRRTLSPAEAQDGMEVLREAYQHLVVSGSFGRLKAVYTTVAYEAGENEAITVSGSPVIGYPATITDPCTGDPRAPRDWSVVRVNGATPVTKIYDAALASWVTIEGLTLDSPAPLSVRLGLGLAAIFACASANEYGVTPDATTLGLKTRAMLAITGKWSIDPQPADVEFF